MQCSVLILLTSLLVAGAFPPLDLSNYGNKYVCDTRVRLIRPETVEDVQEVVKRYSNVQAVGAGASWNREFFCPVVSDDAAGIAMTTIRPLSIDLDESGQSVWVSAGVITWDLMLYLANHVTPSAPRGYALGMTPFYVNQTIAGAVATGTHGSTFIHGSLSQQVLGFKVVLANGSHVEISPDDHPLYFNAFRVNVGRLGVVTDVKMAVVKEALMRRTVREGIPSGDVLSDLGKIQETYEATGELPSDEEGAHLLYSPGETSFYKIVTRLIRSGEDTPYDPDFAKASREFAEDYLETNINAPTPLPRTEGEGTVVDGIAWELPEPFPQVPFILDPGVILNFSYSYHPIYGQIGNATAETHLIWPILPYTANPTSPLSNDYELAVPLDKAAGCLEGLVELIRELKSDPGLRIPLLCRFVPKEDGLLSLSGDNPKMHFSLTDYIVFNTSPPKSNVPFHRLMAYLLSSPKCSSPRLHWGKAGWPDAGCWNGAETFGKAWCDFGCVANDLDPDQKFVASNAELWNWEGAQLDRCCTKNGYDTTQEGCHCALTPNRNLEDCSSAPFTKIF